MGLFDKLHFEAQSSAEDSATFAITDSDSGWQQKKGKFLAVSVAEEQAVDSYNETFTCTIHLTEKQAGELRDWLNKNFP